MLNRKRLFIYSLLSIFILLSSVFSSSCSTLFKTDQETDAIPDAATSDAPIDEEIVDDPTTKDYDNGITFKEEEEGFQPKFVKGDVSNYVGEWEATSGNAHYLLGSLDLDIKENGRWTANIAEEKDSGTWTETENGIALKGTFFSCHLGFSTTKQLLLQYLPFEDSTESNIIVLTKKN